MTIKPSFIFLILSSVFLGYSLSIYLKPMFINESILFNKHSAANGRLVWQKYNCQACHQLYGLGGYLGPDLTNIISDPSKGEVLVRAMIKSGTKQMPAYTPANTELEDLIEFLKAADASGKADPTTFRTNGVLMIEGETKP